MVVYNVKLIICKANLSRDVCYFSQMDPYCIFTVDGKAFKTDVKENSGKYPMWNQTYTFSSITNTDFPLSVYHDNKEIGSTRIIVPQEQGRKFEDCSFQLYYKGKVVGNILIDFISQVTPVQQVNVNYNPYYNSNPPYNYEQQNFLVGFNNTNPYAAQQFAGFSGGNNFSNVLYYNQPLNSNVPFQNISVPDFVDVNLSKTKKVEDFEEAPIFDPNLQYPNFEKKP